MNHEEICSVAGKTKNDYINVVAVSIMLMLIITIRVNACMQLHFGGMMYDPVKEIGIRKKIPSTTLLEFNSRASYGEVMHTEFSFQMEMTTPVTTH